MKSIARHDGRSDSALKPERPPDRPGGPSLPRKTLSNQQLMALLQRGEVRARRRVGQASDPLEQEADRVADAITSVGDAPAVQRQCACGGGQPCEACEAPEVQRKSRAPADAGGGTDAAVSAALGSDGRPLDSGTRGYFERRFDRDFSRVRVHTSEQAAASADALSAEAFTSGSNIAFARNRYAPDAPAGRWLLAHELAHVVQQGDRPPGRRVHRFGEEGQPCTVAVPYTSGDIELSGGETVTVVTWEDSAANATVELPAPYVHAYEPFQIPKIYLQRESATGTDGPVIIGSIPVVFEGAPIGLEDLSGGGPPAIDFGPVGPGQLTPPTVDVSMLTTPGTGFDTPMGVAPGLTSTGLSLNALAFGDMSWLATEDAARFALSRDYWSPMVPRSGDIFLDRLGNTWPRNLEPKISTNPTPWLSRGFTQAELSGIPDMVRRYNAGLATADEIALLRRAADLHIGGASPGAPFASYMTPDHNLTWGSAKRFRVRVSMPAGNVIDVSVPNAFNEFGAMPGVTNVEEAEFLAIANNEGRIVSVERAAASGESTFLMRHSNKIRWGGRILVVAGLAVSAHRIATAEEGERARVIGEEGGGMAGGAAGTGLAIAGCITFGVATGGVGLFLCGLVGGAAGAMGGSAVGGAVGEGVGEVVDEYVETIKWVAEHDSPGSLMAPGIITPYVMRGGYGGLLRSPADVMRAEERGSGR